MAFKADNVIDFKDLECPICLEQFKVPTALPCLHTFCLKCLTSHITDNVTQAENVDKFNCPVCRKEIQSPQPGIPSSEWAKSFPIDNLKASMQPDSKEQLNCDSCAYEGTTSSVQGFCIVCKEHLCNECIKFHHKTKALRGHKIIYAEELAEIPDYVVHVPNEDMCSAHLEEEIQFFCKDHNGLFCSSCAFLNHRTCQQVFDLKLNFKEVLEMFKPSKIIDKLIDLEAKLRETTEEKGNCIEKLKHQADHLIVEIQDLRQKVNALFDKIQDEVKEQGNRIYKEMSMKLLDEKQQCQSLMAALKNSHSLVETVTKFGSRPQVVSTLLKVEEQLEYYVKTVCHFKEDHKQADMKLELDSRLKQLGDLKWKDLVDVKCTDKKYINLEMNVCEKKIKLADSDLHCCGEHASFAAYMSKNRVVLVDWDAKTCRLYGTAFDRICEYPMLSSPSAVCKVGAEEFAIALPLERKIQYFISNNSIKPTKFFRTRLACCGLAPLENRDLAVTYLSNRFLYVAILSESGFEKKCIQLDECKRTKYKASIAIDPTQTRAYVTCNDTNTLYALELEGRKCFLYQNPTLRDPDGIAVDTFGNVFVVGSQSHNIHQLSPEGNLLRIITDNISPFPHDICFNESGDQFLVTFNDPEYLVFHYQ
ncbi:hypothetical protein ACJMK2_006355 [Sinanodonta woodiana]|uniref:Uncharacterized protein n=1 Tax=Sinanodonta woodiana TaxID=1069815 RepID=A0ABD3VSY2_SINWO